MLFCDFVLLNGVVMNKVIRGAVRKIIYKVFMQCMAEYQAGNLLSKLDDVYKRTTNVRIVIDILMINCNI